MLYCFKRREGGRALPPCLRKGPRGLPNNRGTGRAYVVVCPYTSSTNLFLPHGARDCGRAEDDRAGGLLSDSGGTAMIEAGVAGRRRRQ